MMTQEEIQHVVIREVSNLTNVDRKDINIDSILKDDLNFDSIDTVEVVMELEMRVKISVEDSAIESFKTVGDIVNYITPLMNGE